MHSSFSTLLSKLKTADFGTGCSGNFNLFAPLGSLSLTVYVGLACGDVEFDKFKCCSLAVLTKMGIVVVCDF